MNDYTNSKHKELIGWYSEKAAQRHGTSFWKTKDGKEVEVTAVGAEYYFPDKVFVGDVVKWSRRGRGSPTSGWECKWERI